MKRNAIILIILLLVAILQFSTSLAQTETPGFNIYLSRIFGYGGGDEIQGVFDLSPARADREKLNQVEYFIDGQTLGTTSEAPFAYRFTTDDYTNGTHTLTARGQTASGEELLSNTITINFVSAEEGWKAGGKIALPIFALVAVIMVISSVLPLITGKKLSKLPLGAERKYGVNGGTICPKCKRPFPMQFLSLNLLTGKLERCPFCGKWSILRSQPIEKLRQAETDELKMAQPKEAVKVMTEEEKLRKELDQSKYTDM